MKTTITLGDMADKGMRMLEVACRKCPRRGRLSIARLIAEHGRDEDVDLRAVIATTARGCRTRRLTFMTAAERCSPSAAALVLTGGS
jgi:hypothetical protein